MAGSDHDQLQIRSYRVCFQLERRIYRLEQWRLPVAWGVPLRGVAYAAAALLAILLAAGVPVVGAAIATLPAPVRFLILPLGIAYGLTALRVDGRPAHAAVGAVVRHALAPGWVSGFAACASVGTVARLGDLTIAHDHTASHLRRARVIGPCRVLLRYPGRVGVRRRGARLVVAQTSDRAMQRGKTITLGEGQTLELRS